ncbi:MAG: DUF5916 domain-containing protein [Pyrinomonadaceae bacterium]
MKSTLFLLIAFIFTVNSYAQTATKTETSADNYAPSPTIEEKKVESKPDVSPTPEKTSNIEKTGKTDKSGKKDGKAVKSAVNVSTRFRETITPEKLLPVNIPRLETPPVIDGKLDDEVWKHAAVFKDFYQTSPGDNIAPSKPTVAYLAYDAENLYMAFYCYDEPDKIRATVAKRDAVFGEDNVRVHLDTYDDQRRAYVLGFNPLGVQQDGIYTEGSNNGPDFSVDIVMESKGIIVSDGWTLEVKVPFKSLRYSAGKGKMWGIHVSRNIDRFNDEFDSWMPRDQNMSSWLVQEGKITGLDNIKVERTLEIVPSITVSESGNRKRTFFESNVAAQPIGAILDPGRFRNDGIKQDIGVNLKLNITPNVTLDAAYNPDFAEIEADAPVVLANQRFPIFFQEKRPFFLEGADIFNTPLQVFYSRTIVDPDLAAKLTGKIGKISFGLLAASDNAPGNYSEEERADPIFRPSQEFLDKNALFSVVRVKRDFGKENNIGFFGTMRVFPRQRNFLSGVDGKFKFGDQTTMQFQVAGSHSRRRFYDPEEDNVRYRNGNGVGYYFNLDYTTKHHGWFIEAIGRSQDYRADAGFTRRTNTNNVFLFNRFSREPKPKARLISVDWRQFARMNYDWQGHSQDSLLGNNFQFALQGNTFINAEFGVGYERLFEGEFGPKRVHTVLRNQDGAFSGSPERSAYQPYGSINVNKTVNKQLSLYGFVGTILNSFDYDFGNGFRNGLGTRYQRVSPGYADYLLTYDDFLSRYLAGTANRDDEPRPPQQNPGKGRQFDLQVGGEYKPIDPLRISLEYTKSKLRRNDTGKIAFDDNIFTLRSTYQFTRFTFLRTRIDYDSLSSNVSGQILAGWNPHPGTAFYVGYNDNFNYNGFSPYTGQLEPRFERNGRTFFIRASYLFRKSF